jgi:uncharacterized protein YndB with AHSA1/START domain
MPDGIDLDTTDLGELERSDAGYVLRFTRRLTHPPEKVWRALVEPDQLEAWFPTTIEGEHAAGAPLHFRHRDGLAEPFDGEMLSFEPPSLLELRWGEDILRFELTPDGEGTLLVFCDTIQEVGKASRDGAGWHECLDRLAFGLAGQEPPWSGAARWQEVHPGYVERLGPEASTIGPPEEWERKYGDAAGD